MANLLQYLNKKESFDRLMVELSATLEKIKKEHPFQNETELRYELAQQFYDALNRLHQPSFRYIPAYYTPSSTDYNGMMEQAKKDIDYLLADSLSLYQLLDDSLENIDQIRKQMNQEAQRLHQSVEDLKSNFTRNQQKKQTIYSESFNNEEQKFLSLPIRSSNSYMKEAIIEIVSSSNGFPGNTHIADLLNGKIQFDGEGDPHFDLSQLKDNSKESWFEYEMFNLADDVMDQCNHLGFDYKEGVSWVSEEEILTLTLKLTLPSKPTINWIDLSPFISERKGVKAGQVVSCLISNGVDLIQEDTTIRTFNQDLTYLFNPQPVDHVLITLKQPYAYHVQVGHLYHVKDEDEAFPQRINGKRPSIQSLGYLYDAGKDEYLQPSTAFDNLHLNLKEETKADLFQLPIESGKKASFELISAKRYSVGIQTIDVCYKSFGDEQEYLCEVFESTQPIQTLLLEATEVFPTTWPYKPEESIQYSFSIDKGRTWHPITPRHRAFNQKCSYRINHSDLKTYLSQQGMTSSGVLSSLEDVYQVQLKIDLKGDKTIDNQTPLLKHCRLLINVGGEKLA